MIGIRRVGAPRFEQRDGRLLIHFTLNRPPDPTWIHHFKADGLSAPLNRAKATIDRRELSVEVPSGSNLWDLVTALDCFIECANILSPAARRPRAAGDVRAGTSF